MEAKLILSILKDLKVACFKEDVNGDRLGNLVYQNNTFSVKLYRDSVCQYIFLEHSLNGVKNINDFDTFGEAAKWMEKNGWKNRFYDNVSRDIVDETMKNF